MEAVRQRHSNVCRLSLFGLIAVLWLLCPLPLAAQDQAQLYLPLVIRREERPALAGKILFTSFRDGNYEIYVMDANGANPVNLTRHPELDMMARWSPDGRKIAFVSKRHDANGGAEVYIMNADGSGVRRLTHSDIAAITPNWSRDGQRIIFANVVGYTDSTEDYPLRTELYSVRLDGTGLTRVTFTGPPYYQRHIFLTSPMWSPDGSRFLFTLVVPYTTYAIHSVATMTPGEQDFEDVEFSPDEPDEGEIPLQVKDGVWSPDGSQLAVSVLALLGKPELGIAVLNIAAKEWHFLTENIGDRYPTWSPSGDHIAYTSVVDGQEQYDIYVIGADGSHPVRITNHPEADFDPDWH